MSTQAQSQQQANTNQWVTTKTFDSGLKKKFSQIQVDDVSEHAFKPDRQRAQLRQVVQTEYPSSRVNNSLVDSLYSIEDFDLEEGQTYDSTRVTWIDVPSSETLESVQQKIANLETPVIFQILSSSPVMTEEQKNWMNSLETDEEKQEFQERIGRSQAVRTENSEGEMQLVDRNGNFIPEDGEGNPAEGEEHRVQYKVTGFSMDGSKQDEDYRASISSTTQTEESTAAADAQLTQ